jgi:hypothetical protein
MNHPRLDVYRGLLAVIVGTIVFLICMFPGYVKNGLSDTRDILIFLEVWAVFSGLLFWLFARPRRK